MEDVTLLSGKLPESISSVKPLDWLAAVLLSEIGKELATLDDTSSPFISTGTTSHQRLPMQGAKSGCKGATVQNIP